MRQSGYLDVVGEAGSGREGLELIRELEPNVAVLDYQMPDLDGLDVVHAIVRDGLPTRALILSALTDSAVVFRALEEGAQGYLSKESRRAEIVDAVLRVAKGETVVPPELAAGLASQIRLRAKQAAPVLSERERQVLEGFARGLSIPDLAAELYLGASTVKTHTQRLYEKLGVRTAPSGCGGHAARIARVSAATGVLIEHAFRGAHIQRILRLLLGLFFVGVLIFQPPDQHLALCWLVVICYALWSIAVAALVRAAGVRSLHYAWLALFVDVFTVAALTLIADSSAQQSWAPYLLINGFFVVPVIAAAQLNPWISAIVAVPAVLVYLVSSLVIRKVDADPISEIVLRTGLLAVAESVVCCCPASSDPGSRRSPGCWTSAMTCWPRWSPLSNASSGISPRPCMTVLCNTCSPPVKSWRRLKRGIRRPWNGSMLPWPRPPGCCAPR